MLRIPTGHAVDEDIVYPLINIAKARVKEIDIDFSDKDLIANYIRIKYGVEYATGIRTFSTIKAKGAIKRAAEALGIDFATVSNEITKCIPDILDDDDSLKWFVFGNEEKDIKPIPELYKYMQEYPELFRIAFRLEDAFSACSMHPAGIMISSVPMQEITALAWHPKTETMITEYQFPQLEKMGLMKVDLLSVNMLNKFAEAIKLIDERHSIKIDLPKLPLNDVKTYKLFQQGKTITAFQFESTGMMKLCKDMHPICVEDLAAANALFRPGPNRFIEGYLAGRTNPLKVQYLHPDLEPLLCKTYGIVIYQEQAMQIVSKFGGLSLTRADTLRKAISKKDKKLMSEIMEEFLESGIKRGINEDVLKELIDQLITFGSYSFNLSHSVAYSYLAYYSMYLKANYPVEWLCACITSEIGDLDTVSKYIVEANSMGIKLATPDINSSIWDLEIQDNNIIRFALNTVKGVGVSALQKLEEYIKTNGPITSLVDFFSFGPTDKTLLESLAKAGAFESLGFKRSQIVNALPGFLKAKQSYKGKIDRLKKKREVLSTSIVDNMEEYQEKLNEIILREGKAFVDFRAIIEEELCGDTQEFSPQEIMAMEQELLGFYISCSPLTEAKSVLDRMVRHKASAVEDLPAGTAVIVGGYISNIKEITTKFNSKMAKLTIEDGTGSIQISVMPRQYSKNLSLGKIIVVNGFWEISEQWGNAVKASEVKIIDQNMIDKANAAIVVTTPHKTKTMLVMLDDDARIPDWYSVPNSQVTNGPDLYQLMCLKHYWTKIYRWAPASSEEWLLEQPGVVNVLIVDEFDEQWVR